MHRRRSHGLNLVLWCIRPDRPCLGTQPWLRPATPGLLAYRRGREILIINMFRVLTCLLTSEIPIYHLLFHCTTLRGKVHQIATLLSNHLSIYLSVAPVSIVQDVFWCRATKEEELLLPGGGSAGDEIPPSPQPSPPGTSELPKSHIPTLPLRPQPKGQLPQPPYQWPRRVRAADNPAICMRVVAKEQPTLCRDVTHGRMSTCDEALFVPEHRLHRHG